MNIKKKIIINTIIISSVLIVFSMLSLWSQFNKLSKNLLFSVQRDRLTSIRHFKTIEIEAYFKNLLENLSMLATNYVVINGLQDFSKNFPTYFNELSTQMVDYRTPILNMYINDFTNKFKYYNNGESIDPNSIINNLSTNSLALQYSYIVDQRMAPNNQSNSNKNLNNYDLIHNKYHGIIKLYQEQFDFQDILLVDLFGNIVYSVNKELDFATSLINGPYAKSNLADLYKTIILPNNVDNNFIAITDFAPYLASYNNPAAFIGVPIYNPNAQKIGLLIARISISSINKIMSNNREWEKIGLGGSINTSIVGSDYTLRSNNRFFLENPWKFFNDLRTSGFDDKTINLIRSRNSLIGILKTDTLAVSKAIAGEEGFAEYIDYRKIDVISSFAPLKLPGLNWVIVVKMNTAEALKLIVGLRHKILFSGIVISILFIIFSLFLGHQLASRITIYIEKITDQINKIANTKDLTMRVSNIENSEFTVMVNALNDFINSLQQSLVNIINLVAPIDPAGAPDLGAAATSATPGNMDKLCQQIRKLSQEFKIIEHIKERTKYW